MNIGAGGIHTIAKRIIPFQDLIVPYHLGVIDLILTFTLENHTILGSDAKKG